MSESRGGLAGVYAELGQALLKPPAGDSEAEIEFHRLFYNPQGAPCPPWQSVYMAAQGQAPQLFGDAHRSALSWYRQYGFKPVLDNEPADHLGLLLLFYARLLTEEEDDEAVTRFESEHLAWAPLFIARLEAEARHQRYQALARELSKFL